MNSFASAHINRNRPNREHTIIALVCLCMYVCVYIRVSDRAVASIADTPVPERHAHQPGIGTRESDANECVRASGNYVDKASARGIGTCASWRLTTAALFSGSG